MKISFSVKALSILCLGGFIASPCLAQSKAAYRDADAVAQGIIALSAADLKIASPALAEVLSKTFPKKPLNSSSSSVGCIKSESEPCQWYAASSPSDEDEPSPMPALMLWFKAGKLYAVTTEKPTPFARSANWSCAPIAPSITEIVDCYHENTPAAAAKKSRKLHAQWLNSAG